VIVQFGKIETSTERAERGATGRGGGSSAVYWEWMPHALVAVATTSA
jgi:hypothetical protein